MIADVSIQEKSFGSKILLSGAAFSIGDKEKIGVIGRNGAGKSTLFAMLAGTDTDYIGEIVYRRGTVVVATAQEHHGIHPELSVLQYVLAGLPEYTALSRIIETYPENMGDNLQKIQEYTEALQRFEDKGFYQIEQQIERELNNFQLGHVARHPFSSLSGGQKRLVEIVKIMHSKAHLALVDEPTNHMDYVAKQQFIDWMRSAKEAVLVITHDRDVLKEVDRIIELKDGSFVSYKGNYDAYLKQNAVSTGTKMTEHELVERRIVNLKAKVVQFRRLKEKARDPDTIKQFKRRETSAQRELEKLETVEKPTFWIDKTSAASLDYKTASRYDKFKAKNIRMKLSNDESRSKHVLVDVKNVSLGYNEPLFEGVNIDLREGEAVELRGRNGAGKTTLIKAILAEADHIAPSSQDQPDTSRSSRAGRYAPAESGRLNETPERAVLLSGSISIDKHVRIGLYEQEVSSHYFNLPLTEAIERVYLDRGLSITTTKIRELLNDYLFTDTDSKVPLSRLSGGQKARFQLISMLANDPQLLILDEPTNHLDLPSIEELESALLGYSGAILYVSHDGYFRQAMGGSVVHVGA